VCECETRFLERKEASNPPSVMKMSETRCSVLDSMTGGGGKKGDDLSTIALRIAALKGAALLLTSDF
jgi:hypothetical protein